MISVLYIVKHTDTIYLRGNLKCLYANMYIYYHIICLFSHLTYVLCKMSYQVLILFSRILRCIVYVTGWSNDDKAAYINPCFASLTRIGQTTNIFRICQSRRNLHVKAMLEKRI